MTEKEFNKQKEYLEKEYQKILRINKLSRILNCHVNTVKLNNVEIVKKIS